MNTQNEFIFFNSWGEAIVARDAGALGFGRPLTVGEARRFGARVAHLRDFAASRVCGVGFSLTTVDDGADHQVVGLASCETHECVDWRELAALASAALRARRNADKTMWADPQLTAHSRAVGAFRRITGSRVGARARNDLFVCNNCTWFYANEPGVEFGGVCVTWRAHCAHCGRKFEPQCAQQIFINHDEFYS